MLRLSMKTIVVHFSLVLALLLPAFALAAFNDVTLTTSTVLSVGSYTLNVTGSSGVIQSIGCQLRKFYHQYARRLIPAGDLTNLSAVDHGQSWPGIEQCLFHRQLRLDPIVSELVRQRDRDSAEHYLLHAGLRRGRRLRGSYSHPQLQSKRQQ